MVVVVDKVLSIEAAPRFLKFWAFSNCYSKSYESEMEMRSKKLVTKLKKSHVYTWEVLVG